MDLSQLVKRIVVLPGFTAPTTLTFDDIVATAITRDDLADDVAGINESIELIRRTRGGGWPTEPVTGEYNFVDLVWHEQEFREATSFAYVVRRGDEYLGCCYLYPVGRRTPLSAELMECDVDASWWVTPSAYDRGYYTRLYEALRRWTTEEFPFANVHYSNVEIPRAGRGIRGS